MARSKKKKLIYQFLSFILPFIISSIVITGVVLSVTNYNFFQKTIRQDYRNILKSSAGEIRLFMDNAQRNLESLALLIASTKLDSWQKEIALTAFIQTNPQFSSIELYSGRRKKIISTISGDQHLNAPDPDLFDRALSGQVAISGVMPDEDNIPQISMAVPTFHLGKVNEVLWAQLNLKSIWDVLERITIGETGQVYILDLHGRTIAHREIDRVVRAMPAIKPELLNEVRSKNSPVAWTEDKKGAITYNLGTSIPDLEWIVVLSQPASEIYAYLYRNLFWAVFVTVIICIIAVFFGWRWIRRFLLPIQILHRQVRLIGQGNLDQKVSIKAENEIGDLGAAFNDMSDSLRKYIEREVENAKALAHSKNLALLGTASSKMTHEVGNFLNNMHMALSGLKRESLSQQGENILKILEKESGRLNEFIQKFLLFAKKPALHLQEMRLDLILREILTIIGPAANKKGISISLDWDPQIPPVRMDAVLMSQVINNLLKNSIEAISRDGEITITGRIENENLILSVKDTGMGIDPKHVDKIFEPFLTTKGARGTGLGTPIVKSNVEAHGGSIECSSTPGKGTEFIIRLPIR